MKASVTVHSRFAAAHLVVGHPRCFGQHGHGWRVDVTMSKEIGSSRIGSIFDEVALLDSLQAICHELDFHDLNEMLPGTITSPDGVAVYIRERLVMSFPNITRVAITIDGGATSEMEWQIR